MTQITGQQVLDAWLETGNPISDQIRQHCLNVPIVLKEFLYQECTLATMAKVEKALWEYLKSMGKVIDEVFEENVAYLNELIADQSSFLEYMEMTEREYILASISGYPTLVNSLNSGNLTIAEILITAPGIIFEAEPE